VRTIALFVLRLLVDTEEPSALRGTVRLVSVGESQGEPFRDGQTLLAALGRLCREEAARATRAAGAGKAESDGGDE